MYAVRIASMILRTARFLCVLYAEITVNATAEDVQCINELTDCCCCCSKMSPTDDSSQV